MQINDEAIAAALESEGQLIRAAAARDDVPARPGFYSIFVDTPNSLPAPFNDHLQRKCTNLLYIGIASVSLSERLVEQDLYHRTSSTFFRGMGAVLGYRPQPGSLVGKRNQNNYKFSRSDTDSIIAWNREHLAIRFVAADTTASPNAERYLIGRNCPILNTMHNPQCLAELADLRLECRDIARRTG